MRTYDRNARGTPRVRKECARCGHHVSAHRYDPDMPRSGQQRCSVPGCPCVEYRRPEKGERIHRHQPEPDPSVYLSASEGRFRVISQGVPVAPDRMTEREALEDARRYGLKLAARFWDGDVGEWRPMAHRPNAKAREYCPICGDYVADLGEHLRKHERAAEDDEDARGGAHRPNPSTRERAADVLAGHGDPGAGTPIANASEVDLFEDNSFVREGPLWELQFGAYGSTHVYVWADGVESAFEVAVEWLDDHAPGLLVMVNEEDYQRAAEELGKVWDPSDPDYEIIETAEADMTMIGHTTLKHGNAVASWEWYVREVERGSAEWNEIVERSREESGEYEENSSRSQDVVLAAIRGQRKSAGAFHASGGIIYSYDLPIADVRNADGPFYVLDKSRSPSVTTSKHIGYVHTWLKHIKSWIQPNIVSEIQI